MNENTRKNVDLLIEQFWKRGYLTLSRKYGTYLPEPGKVGAFDVDIIARHKKDIAIGITLSSNDFFDSDLASKLTYLATRHTRFTNRRVKLFIGVPTDFFKKAKAITGELDPGVQSNIKLVQIVDESLPSVGKNKRKPSVLFS
jgi:hypothetical protein